MAQLWGGRFTKETDQLVYNFNASITFDRKLYREDIEGSIAHVTMMAKQGVVTDDEKKTIIDGLNGILADVENGALEISEKYEDIHSFVEATLIDRVGDAGKKLHTGRSRNDQVAVDMRLYVRKEVLAVDALLKELAADPENKHLYRQTQLISEANICTISSYCLGLVKENFALLGISPKVRVLDETESAVMLRRVTDELIKKGYDEDWIKKRIKSIQDRKRLADIWKENWF